MKEGELEVQFHRFLIDRLGYPEKSLVRHYAIAVVGESRVLRPDLVVVDEATSTPLAIFEFRNKPASDRLAIDLSHAAELSALMGNVPAFLVTPADGSEGFQLSILVLTQEIPGRLPTTKPYPIAALPSYSQLILASGTAQGRRRVRRTLNWFAALCYGLGILVAVLFCVSYFGRRDITPSQFGVIAAALALFVLPHTAKLKMLGIEFERRIDPPRRRGSRPNRRP